MDYLPPSPTLPQDLPECVTRSAREHSTERKESQKLGTRSVSNPATVVSAITTQSTKKTSFRNEKDSCVSKPSDDVLTSNGASVSTGPSSSTQSEETHNTLETGSPAPPTTTSSFPYLKESGLTPEQQEGLSIRLCVESEDIICKFWRLHSRVYKSLCEQNVPVDKLVTHLLLLDAFDPVSKATQKPALQTFVQELHNAESIEKVLYIMKDYFSFFNYRVIQHIVDGFGTDQDKVELQNYKKAFDEYSKRRVYECPPDYGSKSDSDHVDLIFVLDSVYEKFTLKELKKFEYRLSRIFCVSPQSVLRLCQVEEVYFQLNLQVCITLQYLHIEDCKSWQLPGGCNSGIRSLAVVPQGLVFNFQ